MGKRPRRPAPKTPKLSKQEVAYLRGYSHALKKYAPPAIHGRFADLKLITEKLGGWVFA